MAGHKRTIHVGTRILWLKMSEVAPDMQLHDPSRAAAGNGDAVVDPMALVFADPDAETHVYPLDEEQRKSLIQTLTGGVVLPT